jgi:hypothetical protein
MKVDFDSRANALTMDIKDEWDSEVKVLHEANKQNVRKELKYVYGIDRYELKENNFKDMGPTFPSIIAFHNKFLNQSRTAFIMGGYYPAFTGITTLTERVLNHLVIALRDDFKHTPEYKKVYNKSSFTDWDDVIETLEAWDILLPDSKPDLLKLKKLRHRYAAHFNPETDVKDREFSLEAIQAFQEFIRIQFGFFGMQPWFIPDTQGEFFIKKEYENHPFIKRIYLPNCVLVGPGHRVVMVQQELKIEDDEYPDIEVSDEEFVHLREKAKHP